MAQLVLSREAHADAATIVDMLTREAGAAVATRYRRYFDLPFDRLATFPRSGARRPSLGRDIRITVRIARIVDGRRNITRRLLRP
ncbi:MAG: type II toxin-antitoxin system RelE/ParE family toxin [Alphaproteobacteria bacterium]|nr:type II toxin-antitoxin system RelE/ParE family toxin [Alphaproteobacteria bacterium]MBV8409851.1 type II toxin-antitoxin system RelE/ParE family toxin [Alphaproteobacteria bacterium]